MERLSSLPNTQSVYSQGQYVNEFDIRQELIFFILVLCCESVLYYIIVYWAAESVYFKLKQKSGVKQVDYGIAELRGMGERL